MDYKNDELAYLIANHSLEIKKGTKVYLKYKTKEAIPLMELLIAEISEKGGVVFPYYYDKELEDYRLKTLSYDGIPAMVKQAAFQNDFFDAFISIGSNDAFKKSPLNNKEVIRQLKLETANINTLKNNKQWLLLNYPSIVDAQRLNMNYEDYYRYSMNAMTYDFSDIEESVVKLKELLDSTKTIRIIGDNVDLIFNKDNIPSVPLLGNVNLPDGEIYTSPTKDSVNGYIKFNVPSPKENLIFENIHLVFKNGKVIDYYCDDNLEEFKNIIDIDEGAKYIGEFAFGFNPMISKPMNDILYDEKINRSFHLALGNSYFNAYNGNRSALHWDLIYLNKPNNNCSMYFDDQLVYSNGEFIKPKIFVLDRK